MDCSIPDSSVHEILQARILESVAIPFSRGSCQPRDGTWVSHIVDRFFTVQATKEAYIANKESMAFFWLSSCQGRSLLPVELCYLPRDKEFPLMVFQLYLRFLFNFLYF